LSQIFEEIGGSSFFHGLYHVLDPSEVRDATQTIEYAYPEYLGSIVVFAYDWLGRHFAFRGQDQALETVVMEIGAGTSFVIPASPLQLHEIEFVDYPNDSLALGFFEEWRSNGNPAVKRGTCVAYKKPLFLGGSDTIENLEVNDLSVYVHLCAQMRRKIKGID
jgi:hypothetical protein